MTQTDIKPFTKEDLEQADVQLLRDGRWGNARVSVANINGKRWTIKDFSDRHWLVKNSFAKFVLWRELKAVRQASRPRRRSDGSLHGDAAYACD